MAKAHNNDSNQKKLAKQQQPDDYTAKVQESGEQLIIEGVRETVDPAKQNNDNNGYKADNLKSDNLYYIQASILRVQVYLAHGLIYPEKYDTIKTNNDMKDIQSEAPDYITLNKTEPKNTSMNNILLLSVLITDEEAARFEQNGNMAYYHLPIPISRLVGIGVPCKANDLRAFIAGWLEPDVPVPEHLFYATGGVDAATDITQVDTSFATQSAEAYDPDVSKKDVSKKIEEYNRLMGALAYQRNAARYISKRTGIYADYPSLFFNMLNMLYELPPGNLDPEEVTLPILCALFDKKTELTTLQKDLLALIYSADDYIEKARAREVAKKLYGNDTNLAEVFKALFNYDYTTSVSLIKSSIDNLDAIIFAALYQFSNKQANDHRNVKMTLHADWDNSHIIATILSVLGAYYGYTALDAKETRLYEVDKRLSDYIEAKPKIKFHLENKFERIVIESIYTWVFFEKRLETKTEALYDKVKPIVKTEKLSLPPKILYKDQSYQVKDLLVKRYAVTELGRVLNGLEALPGEFIDEESEVGRCLIHTCFFKADEYELAYKKGQHILRYKISNKRLIELIIKNEISVNTCVLITAIEEDLGNRS